MKHHIKISEGKPYPLGARWDGAGVNFAIYSKHAERVYLCLFDDKDSSIESVCIPMKHRTHYIWHCYVEGIFPGQLYGYRVYGKYNPKEGHRFNPSKLLLDPYALAIGRDLIWTDKHFAYKLPDRYDEIDRRNNAGEALLGAVIDPSFTWGDDKPLRIPWKDTIIYEVHIKGFSKLHPLVPEKLRGTYLAFTTDEVIHYLKDLGVTTLEFLPVQHSITEYQLYKHKLVNYWGYNPIAFFAPNPNYAYGQRIDDPINEFKTMVKVLHQAGFEVILDVVFNHTAEGDHTGPTLSFRGIDNLSYYRVYENEKDRYLDFTGCGNTLNHQNHQVLQLIMDSLRYWITEMHVDGFRFDLASALARELYDVDRLTCFFALIQQDPVISQAKLIAEPWDLGKDGYQVGNFPPGWSEWNGKYRDTVRRVINGYENTLSEFATRICGSSDLYKKEDRKTYSSINFVTCHDGFTLRDLVSYNQKHNLDNKANNTDGSDINYSYNHGIEGDTQDPRILLLRLKKQKLFLTTLFISQGVPMLLAGDERNRTQKGNNNAYCQDNEISYLSWQDDEITSELHIITKYLIALRKHNEVLRRTEFFEGEEKKIMDVKDIYWIHPEGREMESTDWDQILCLGMLLPSEFGERMEFYTSLKGDTLLIIFNFQDRRNPFRIPAILQTEWHLIFDSGVHLFVTHGELLYDRTETIIHRLKAKHTEEEDEHFYESMQKQFSDGNVYLPGSVVEMPEYTIKIFKASKNWKEGHVRRNYRRKLLERLSDSLGIQRKYSDLLGRDYKVSDEELLLILRSMHLPVKDYPSIETIYENYINEFWFKDMNLVFVFTEKEHIQLEISIPEAFKEIEIQILSRNNVLFHQVYDKFSVVSTHSIHFTKFKKLKMLKIQVSIPVPLPSGIYELHIYNKNELYSRGKLFITPEKCYYDDKVYTGVWIQLHAIRSAGNLGIGDFGDIKTLARILKKYNYNLIGISPLHYFPVISNDSISPYYPSSRLLLHPVYIDVFSLEEFRVSKTARLKLKEYTPEIEKEKKQKVIDYVYVYKIKKEILYEAYKEFLTNRNFSQKRKELEQFKKDHPFVLHHALWEVAKLAYPDSPPPREIFKLDSPEHRQFYNQHEEEINFQVYLFYTVETQFLELIETLRKDNMYLYLDLAVGCAPHQAEYEYWNALYPFVFSHNARAGAPPDPFSASGQDWGLAVFNPHILKKSYYEPFLTLIKRNLFPGTLLRIDHIMWLYRLFWIVAEGEKKVATYIRYPEKDLFSLLCYESMNKKSIIIGEDLGTVPKEVRDIMKQKNILSWKVLYFEKSSQEYLDPRYYPLQSVATINTHDLPTLAGFWKGRDIEELLRIQRISEETARKLFEQRNLDKIQIIKLLQKKKYFEDDQQFSEDSLFEPDIAYYIHKLLGETPSKIVLVSMYDLLGEVDQPNLPGTTTEYPNWRLRHTIPLEEMEENPYFVKITEALQERLSSSS